jgi:hypothetical protein
VEDREADREAYVSDILVPQVDGGYRWQFGGFILGARAALGYAVSVSTRTEDLSNGEDPSLRDVQETSDPYGAVALDVGYAF